MLFVSTCLIPKCAARHWDASLVHMLPSPACAIPFQPTPGNLVSAVLNYGSRLINNLKPRLPVINCCKKQTGRGTSGCAHGAAPGQDVPQIPADQECSKEKPIFVGGSANKDAKFSIK